MLETLMAWLAPSALGLILLLPCLGLAQYLPALFPSVWLAVVRQLVAVGGTGHAWGMLFGLQLVLAYVIAMCLGRLLTMATRPKRRDVLLAVCATGAAALLAAVIVSKQYWGYYFVRPPLDERVARARQVHSVSLVGTEQGATGDTRFVARRDLSLDEAIQRGRTYPYDAPHYGGLVALADRRLLPAALPSARPATVTSAYTSLEATGLLVSGEPGYPHARWLYGALVEFEDDTGQVLTFVGLTSGQVSNDHHAYYELVLSAPSGSGPPRVLSATRFFYDIAGIEGAEWWVMWCVFTALGNAITVPATVIVRALQGQPAAAHR
jgi:hypothetical protein